jgi:penicillin-binding protein 1A
MLRLLAFLGSLILFGAIVGTAGGVFLFWYFSQDLPEHEQLAKYEPPVMTRLHAGDGSLIAEYATEHRVFVPVAAVPDHVIQAFLSAEDKTFYSHPGVDIFGIANALLRNVKNFGRGRRPAGASTITQQVAKNFLLSNEVSIKRKVREALLAFRIENALSKERILELYLNEIYLGYNSYGVAAAALNYFDKSLDQLTIEEAAYLAALPKAPNNYHPVRKREAAIARRNWVIGRMMEDGHVAADVGAAAQASDLIVHEAGTQSRFKADYFAETVRRDLLSRYGEEGLYKGGMSVKLTLNPDMQLMAEEALRKGLIDYDLRHGWRGPLANFPEAQDWKRQLAEVTPPAGLGNWQLAVVLGLDKRKANIALQDGRKSYIPFAAMKWARPWQKEQKRGRALKKPSDALVIGDVIVVEEMLKAPKSNKKKKSKLKYPHFALRQMPDIDGAIIALDPHTGRVLAMVGGFSHDESEFNRATQALRQPGSAFKPVVYAAALDNGFHPASIIMDGPFVIDQGEALGKWKPSNYSQKFYGPSTLRLGMELSRNLMTVRIAQYIGIEKVVNYARKLGVDDNMAPYLPMALGAGETTLLQLTTAYASFANGGKKVVPSFIDRIQDRWGRTVYRHDQRVCDACRNPDWQTEKAPELSDNREQILESGTAYQITSLLEGVVQNGTGRRIRSLGHPLAGKTGTTNESRDTWFIGFSADLAVGVFAGFDNPRTLGKKEQGASVAAPIFKDFFAKALQGKPARPFRVPKDIQLIRFDRKTGLKVGGQKKGVIWEAFKLNQTPDKAGSRQEVSESDKSKTPRKGTGGLY